MQENKKSLRDGSLQSSSAFSHGGTTGHYLWVDPAYELVGAFFSVRTYPEDRPESPL